MGGSRLGLGTVGSAGRGPSTVNGTAEGEGEGEREENAGCGGGEPRRSPE